MKSPDEVLREGELEKRSDSLFQLWKKKRGVLTSDRLSLFPASPRARPKELRFHSLLKVDCVERTGKYVYFTIVTTDRKEIDFRCAGESCWNAAIALALIDFQNRRALQGFRSRQERPAPAAPAAPAEAAEAAAPSEPSEPSEPSDPSPQPQPRTP
ncbi:Pleckstrin y-like domain A member 2 [Saguinus oedipus]|uniref:Pleckstrin homology-like domain family A member 2 n=1 Tax=Saguinus oedipus TaxID=9490 RepID=A0ABQ9UUG5_SAGOE|nr:Pleckstrin y-like domain A member 2 [Saguinus oedipus]